MAKKAQAAARVALATSVQASQAAAALLALKHPIPALPDGVEIRYKPVDIPTDQHFLKQYYPWTHGKVSKKFKRDKDRIPDCVQRVRCRLLQKEFISRWFFKHLKDDFVDRVEAERMLGGVPVAFVGSLRPVHGNRMDPGSLWRITDLLGFAKFDHHRFFYSPQNHTIDSDKVLYLLGYWDPGSSESPNPSDYVKLQSLWRQGKLIPAEITEHECRRRGVVGSSPRECPECVHGLALLRARGLSLADNWDARGSDGKPDLDRIQALKRMRWNDSQVRPFLRRWRKTNNVYEMPRYIMRPYLQIVAGSDGKSKVDSRTLSVAEKNSSPQSVDAGLLAYAEKIINNEVINGFKELSRTDDMSKMIYNNGLSPELSDSETVAFDSDSDEEHSSFVATDSSALDAFNDMERRTDIASISEKASLSPDELEVIRAVDLMELSVKQYAAASGLPSQRIHRIRASAIRKLRGARMEPMIVSKHLREVCDLHECTESDLFGPALFGPVVVARTELFARLHGAGMSEEDMADHFRYPREKVAAAIQRASRSGGNSI